MVALIQRSFNSSVCVDGKTVGAIDKGMVVFVGVNKFDDDAECDYLAKKVANLRIFHDENGKMNKSILDIGGQILAISNFTLCADARKGTRPSYDMAMRPERANELYERFMQKLSENGVERIEKGIFGADMRVSVENDGPVSIILDTDKIMAKKNNGAGI